MYTGAPSTNRKLFPFPKERPVWILMTTYPSYLYFFYCHDLLRKLDITLYYSLISLTFHRLLLQEYLLLY